MDKLFLLAITLIPVVASAHPDHSHGTYSLIHYFGSSHLVFGIFAVAALALGYRMIRRFFAE